MELQPSKGCPPCRRFRRQNDAKLHRFAVVRRVGGLEVVVRVELAVDVVVRRVGGLEGVGGITCESSAIDEETEAR